jgi:hypothetical protein
MRSRLWIVGLILSTLLTLSGCYTASQLVEFRPKSASGSTFAPETVPEGKAVVYFYRPDRFMMSGRIISISIPHEAKNCFSMAKAGYYSYVTDPGKLHVSAVAHSGNADYNLFVKVGDVRYVKLDYDDSQLSCPAVFEEVSAEKALPEIKKCRVITPCEK